MSIPRNQTGCFCFTGRKEIESEPFFRNANKGKNQVGLLPLIEPPGCIEKEPAKGQPVILLFTFTKEKLLKLNLYPIFRYPHRLST
jgi:hypothetical protein